MPVAYPARSRTPILGAVIALHVLTFAVWQTTRRAAPPRVPEEDMQVIWIAPRATPPSTAPLPSPRRARAATSNARTGARKTVTPQAITLPPPVAASTNTPAPAPSAADDPFALSTPVAPDLASAARKAAATIDKQLRDEELKGPKREQLLASRQRFSAEEDARLIGSGTVSSHRSANGDRIDKVRTPFGTYCVRSIPPRAGIDAYERARNAPTVANCN